MATLYIAEYDELLVDAHGQTVMAPKDPPIAEQIVAIGVSHAESVAFSGRTLFVQIGNDSTCSIAFGAAPVATTSNQRIPANNLIFKGVTRGNKISVIANT